MNPFPDEFDSDHENDCEALNFGIDIPETPIGIALREIKEAKEAKAKEVEAKKAEAEAKESNNKDEFSESPSFCMVDPPPSNDIVEGEDRFPPFALPDEPQCEGGGGGPQPESLLLASGGGGGTQHGSLLSASGSTEPKYPTLPKSFLLLAGGGGGASEAEPKRLPVCAGSSGGASKA